jgi:hypothetical protein
MFGDDSFLETGARDVRHWLEYRARGISRTTTTCVFRGDPDRRLGIYGYAGCDIWAIADAGPILQKVTGATGAVYAQGRADFTRSDLILQGYDGVNPDHVSEVIERLGGKPIMFSPELLEPTFQIPEYEYAGTYDKDVVVLSISSDLSRVIYRHREHGFLIDPGGFWLAADVKDALDDLETVKWFGKTFEKVGRLSAEETMENFRRLVPLVREKTGAHVVMFNSLTVDPGRRVMDYKLSHSPHRTRRREFASALVELARDLDFSIVDVDRVVKGVGVEGLGDFVKLTPRHKRAVGQEFVRILQDREVI